MNISINGISVNGMVNNSHVTAGKYDKDSNSIYAGDLTGVPGAAANVEDKRAMARKQARALIKDAWDKDREVARGMDELEKAKREKLEEIQSYRQYKDKVEHEMNSYMEESGVDKESAEHKDLLLLEKYQDYKKGIPVDDFSKEEIQRLKELQDMPRTEYQNKMLELNGARGNMDNAIYDAEQEYKLLASQYAASRINLPKTETMDKVQDAADSIMDAADRDAVAEYVKEGVSEIEKDMEEVKEEADKIKEKKEEEKERIDEAKERREEQEEILDGATKKEQLGARLQATNDNYSNVMEAQDKIQRILKRSNMDIEELKGIEIDFNY